MKRSDSLLSSVEWCDRLALCHTMSVNMRSEDRSARACFTLKADQEPCPVNNSFCI